MAHADPPSIDPAVPPLKKPRMTKKRRQMLLEQLAAHSVDPNGFDRKALLALQDDAYGKRLPDLPPTDAAVPLLKSPRMTKKRRQILLERLAARSADPNGLDREALLALQDDAYGKQLD